MSSARKPPIMLGGIPSIKNQLYVLELTFMPPIYNGWFLTDANQSSRFRNINRSYYPIFNYNNNIISVIQYHNNNYTYLSCYRKPGLAYKFIQEKEERRIR